MNKKLVIDLFTEVLEKYHCSEVTAMQEIETSDNEGWEEALGQEIKGYKKALNELLRSDMR